MSHQSQNRSASQWCTSYAEGCCCSTALRHVYTCTQTSVANGNVSFDTILGLDQQTAAVCDNFLTCPLCVGHGFCANTAALDLATSACANNLELLRAAACVYLHGADIVPTGNTTTSGGPLCCASSIRLGSFEVEGSGCFRMTQQLLCKRLKKLSALAGRLQDISDDGAGNSQRRLNELSAALVLLLGRLMREARS